MRKRYLTTMTALISASTLALTGCSSFLREDVKSYPLASMLTSAEVVDYYAKALEYDSIVSRNVTVHETEYEVYDVEGAKAEKLKNLTTRCESILGQNEYTPTEESLKLVSVDTFNYMKGVLDNEVLSNGAVQNITGALGYYFVDVQYDVSEKAPGTFKDSVNLLGINGAYYKNYAGNVVIDYNYMTNIVGKLNEYYLTNGIATTATFDGGLQTITLNGGIPTVEQTVYDEAVLSDEVDSESTSDEAEANNTDESEKEEKTDTKVLNAPGDEKETDSELSKVKLNTNGISNSDEDTDDSDKQSIENEDADKDSLEDTSAEADVEEESTDELESDAAADTGRNIVVEENTDTTKNYTIVTPSSRQIKLDVRFINKMGSSLRQKAAMPLLSDLYNFSSPEGVISGYGIYPAGSNGLKTFGYNRDELSGTATIRYVFKEDSRGTGEILGTNIYMIDEEITNGATMASNNTLIPEFLKAELNKTIERADRAQVNYDLAGLMSGVYEDVGQAVLRGYKEDSTGVQKYMSTIRQVISRDTSNNTYLVEVETNTTEGPKDVDAYGTYKDISYVTIQQQDDEFVITDWLRVSRTLKIEPQINPDTNTQKRLIALNLAGEISDDNKDEIKGLMSDLYNAGTNRVLNGPYEFKANGEKHTIEKGIIQCFSSDVSTLSSAELEYTYTTLCNTLTMYGVDVSSVYSGTITEWIGGYENQAEFTTEELITFNGMNKGYYEQVYYLVEYQNDQWVITERTILDEYEVDDSETLSTIQERVGQK